MSPLHEELQEVRCGRSTLFRGRLCYASTGDVQLWCTQLLTDRPNVKVAGRYSRRLNLHSKICITDRTSTIYRSIHSRKAGNPKKKKNKKRSYLKVECGTFSESQVHIALFLLSARGPGKQTLRTLHYKNGGRAYLHMRHQPFRFLFLRSLLPPRFRRPQAHTQLLLPRTRVRDFICQTRGRGRRRRGR